MDIAVKGKKHIPMFLMQGWGPDYPITNSIHKSNFQKGN
jgi:hypothetical protein